MKLTHMPHYLYHGTTKRALSRISRQGLRPRSHRKDESGNWKGTVESHPNTIYLTIAYPIYFAYSATSTEHPEDAVIFEIDVAALDRKLFQADEDAVEQVNRGSDGLPADWTMRQRTIFYRNRAHRYEALTSLNALGTCGYRGSIPVSAISRYALIERDKLLHLSLCFDPTISVMNYQYCGEQYRNSVAWLFGYTDRVISPVGRELPLDREGITMHSFKEKTRAQSA